MQVLVQPQHLEGVVNHSELTDYRIYKTKTYSIFKDMKGNRPLNMLHVRRLTKSIEKHGFLLNPILVNEKMQIIDGHHRLHAAMEANEWVFYMVQPGYELKHVHILNAVNRIWSGQEYLVGYADLGIKPYVIMREFMNENKDFKFKACHVLLLNKTWGGKRQHSGGSEFDKFKDGLFEITDLSIAKTNAKKIRMVGEYFDKYTQLKFVQTMVSLFKKEQYNHNRFIRKLKLQRSKLVPCTSMEQYLLVIEEIYNYHAQKKVNLRY